MKHGTQQEQVVAWAHQVMKQLEQREEHKQRCGAHLADPTQTLRPGTVLPTRHSSTFTCTAVACLVQHRATQPGARTPRPSTARYAECLLRRTLQAEQRAGPTSRRAFDGAWPAGKRADLAQKQLHFGPPRLCVALVHRLKQGPVQPLRYQGLREALQPQHKRPRNLQPPDATDSELVTAFWLGTAALRHRGD